MTASFMLSEERKKGKVIKRNKLTVWVKLKTGEVIKRHRKKHSVFVTL